MDRGAHRRRDPAWIERALASSRARFVPVHGILSLVANGDPPRPVLLDRDQAARAGAPAETTIYLGRFAGHDCFACALAGDAAAAAGFGGEFQDLHSVGALLETPDATLLAYARAMVLWHRNHRHCGRCGAPITIAEAGHVLICSAPECSSQQFPRLDPAIIVLVADEDRCLLGRQAGWPAGRYSAIAGFVEPGESLEDAVAREVHEETGVTVRDVRYHSSQPWPFPASLMLGFRARPASTAIELHDRELEDARWFTRDEIAAGRPGLPPKVSISFRLVADWVASS